MFSKVVLLSVLAALAEARFGQEQVPIPAIQAVTSGGAPGVADTLAGAAISTLLAAANPCAKLQKADEIIAQLGMGADSIKAAQGLVAAEQNFNPFLVSIPSICSDPTLPVTAVLRGIVPLVDPAVGGSDHENQLSAASLIKAFNADGLSVAQVMAAQGFTNFTTKDLAGNVGSAPNGGGANDDGATTTSAATGAAGCPTVTVTQTPAIVTVTSREIVNQTIAANTQAATEGCNTNAGVPTVTETVTATVLVTTATIPGDDTQSTTTTPATEDFDTATTTATDDFDTATSTATNDFDTATTTATDNFDTTTTPATLDCNTTFRTSTTPASPPQTTTLPASSSGSVQKSTITGLDFGLCVPTMKFEPGLNGRKDTEFTFQATDPLVNKGQEEALNPNIITNRICDQLTNVCNANAAAKAACLSAKAQILAAGTKDVSTADTWNTALGFAGANTNPDNAPQPGLVGHT